MKGPREDGTVGSTSVLMNRLVTVAVRRSKKRREWKTEALARCLCARRVERGDMVFCDVCGGWSHLSCIGVKAGASLLEGKDFVYFFCLSTCLLSLHKEVWGERGAGCGEE